MNRATTRITSIIRPIIGLGACMLCTSHGFANPAPTPAQQAHAAALAMAKAGNYVGAAAEFLAAYRAEAKPEYLCDVGVAYHRAKTELPRAQLFLARCIERGTVLDSKFMAAIRAAIATVESGLRAGSFTPVDISVTPAAARVEISAFAPTESFVGSRAIYLPFGHHRLTFSADGYVTATRELDPASTASMSISVDLERTPVEAPPVVTPPVTEPVVSPIVKVPPPPVHHDDATPPSKLPAIATSVAAVGLFVGAGLTYHNAHSRADHAQLALDDGSFQADKDYVSRQNTYMVVLGSLGVACAGVSGYLWYRALTPSVEVTPTSTTVSVAGRF